MKKLLWTACTILLIGCYYNVPTYEGFTSYEDVMHWVHENIEQVAEPEGGNDWKTPAQTYADRTGDCEDINGLLMVMLHDAFGVKPEMHGVRMVADDFKTSHALVYLYGYYYDAVFDTVNRYEAGEYYVIGMLSYNEYILSVWYS